MISGSDPGRYLISRRPAGAHLADAWEFPGGKIEPGESPEGALVRELQEELGVLVEVGDVYAVGHHVYPEKEVVLLVYRCRIVSGEPQCLEVAEFRWVTAAELIELPLPPADAPVVARLRREGRLVEDRHAELLSDLEATHALGRALGRAAVEGDTIALSGTLGAGKTSLAQGLGAGLGFPLRNLSSPTFALWNAHTEGGRLPFHHMDWYRLEDPDEALSLGLEDVVGLDGLCAIEWPERLPHLLPADTLEVALAPEGEGRLVVLRAHGPRGRRLIAAARAR